ncbi:MAG TPA: hypothetical protein VNR39_03905 [Pseudolabrys sp.]|nr:hypothetical protein [Pseudolabrys sp.]
MAAAVWLGFGNIAQAAGWQYCLAVSNADHKTYMGMIGAEQAGADALFADALAHAGITADEVQCPRADMHLTMEEMRRYALEYNRNLGMTVVPFNDGRGAQARR